MRSLITIKAELSIPSPTLNFSLSLSLSCNNHSFSLSNGCQCFPRGTQVGFSTGILIHLSYSSEICTFGFGGATTHIRAKYTIIRHEEQGIAVLRKAIVACSTAIERHKGKLVVKEAPRAVSEREDKLLAEQMAKLSRQNEEVSGDENSEDEDDIGMGSIDSESTSSGVKDREV